MNGGCQPDKFDWIKFEQPWAARRAKPMDGWSNGELQEVIRNGRMPGIQSIAVCFYSNATRNLEALILSESLRSLPPVEMTGTRSDF